jgi:hypothetical protein
VAPILTELSNECASKPFWRGRGRREKTFLYKESNHDFLVVELSFVKIGVSGRTLDQSVVLVCDVE